MLQVLHGWQPLEACSSGAWSAAGGEPEPESQLEPWPWAYAPQVMHAMQHMAPPVDLVMHFAAIAYVGE